MLFWLEKDLASFRIWDGRMLLLYIVDGGLETEEGSSSNPVD